MRTHCPKCGTLVITENEGRYAAYCDEGLEAAFLATLTNKSITIPSYSNAEVTNNTNNPTLTSTVACLADPTTNMASIKNQGDGHSVVSSSVGMILYNMITISGSRQEWQQGVWLIDENVCCCSSTYMKRRIH